MKNKIPWTKFSSQEERWTEFSTLEDTESMTFACHALLQYILEYLDKILSHSLKIHIIQLARLDRK